MNASHPRSELRSEILTPLFVEPVLSITQLQEAKRRGCCALADFELSALLVALHRLWLRGTWIPHQWL